MVLERGAKIKPLKVLIYGPEGVGKSTFASHFPSPVFIDTEGSTDHMDVVRTPKPQTWAELIGYVDDAIHDPSQMMTLVIDTADWAERLCMTSILDKNHWTSIEQPGYGKGYTALMEEFGKLLDKLSLLRDRGVNVVFTAHAQMRTVTLPEETGNYDRWELKMQKKTSPLVKEWADMILFANYKTMVIKDESSGKNKARGGQRVMYTTHTTTYDAKNRFGLPDELPFDYAKIAHLIPQHIPEQVQQTQPPVQEQVQMPAPTPAPAPAPQQTAPVLEPQPIPDDLPSEEHRQLYTLMQQARFSEEDVMHTINDFLGIFPHGTNIRQYPPDWLKENIIAGWQQFADVCNAEKLNMPF